MPQVNITISSNIRFLDLVDKSGDCWIWLGPVNPRPNQHYGEFAFKCQKEKAHRYSVRLSGRDIPAGMVVCHKCDNPQCVNPAHLFVGTHKDNFQDAKRKGRLHGQKVTHCPHGHPRTPENTYVTAQGGRKCRTCRKLKRAIRTAKEREARLQVRGGAS